MQRSKEQLSDHFVGEREQRRRNREAQSRRGLSIDHKFELDRDHDRQISRLLTFENPTRINARRGNEFEGAPKLVPRAARSHEN
jgi:hypothetical protein